MPRLSLASRFLLVVLVVTVVPLVGLSLWLVVGTRRAGEALLRERLEQSLLQAAEEIGRKWVPIRSELLSIGEDSAVQRLLQTSPEAEVRLTLSAARAVQLRSTMQSVTVLSEQGGPTWLLDLDTARAPGLVRAASTNPVQSSADALIVDVPVWLGGTDDRLGKVQAWFRPDVLLPVGAGIASATGGVFGVVNRSTGFVILPLPFDHELISRTRFRWMNEEWLTARRSIDEPFIDLIAAAPIAPFALPFQRAAQRGLLALLAVSGVGFLLTVLLTKRLTHSLVQLAEGADAVAAGELDRRVEATTRDEVGRVAHAFNTMTESLRQTLAELSQRQAVAAVGEFAAALAHEIRNPLSAIRLNLQHVEERLPENAPVREPVSQSLRDIQRLENTVAGALRVARTGRMQLEPINLRVPIEAAIRAAQPEIQRRELHLHAEGIPDNVRVRANAAALEQVFLNLLINAAQATAAGGQVGIACSATGATIMVTVWDTGAGLAEDARARAFEPFFSTKPEGSGLGLPVAKRIVIAHGGTIELASEPGRGTQVRVQLPKSSNGAVHAP